MISIQPIDSDSFSVTVAGSSTTTHKVKLSDAYHQRLTAGKISKSELIEQAFSFLLERESNTMILSSFELNVIQSYFPDFESTVQHK